MKILFTGGGTAGHIAPIIAIAREMRRSYQSFSDSQKKEEIKFFYLGPKDEFVSILLGEEGIKVGHTMAGKIRRYLDWKSFFQNFFDILFKTPLGFFQAILKLFFIGPDLIFSKGGFGSIPTVLAAKLLFIPIFLHESDAVPGLANRFISKFAVEVFTSFPKTPYLSVKRIILVGNPIRREILDSSRSEARTFFKLNSKKPVLLILGGSQGAQRINDRILEILPDLLRNFEVLHQTGEKNFPQVKAEAKATIGKARDLENFYHLFPFLKESEMNLALAASDLIISRAGSGSIFEIAAAGKPSILIPLPESAQNHQIKNAYNYSATGASIAMEENNFTGRFLLEKIKYLFSQKEEMAKMIEAAKDFSRPEAAKIIAFYLFEYLK